MTTVRRNLVRFLLAALLSLTLAFPRVQPARAAVRYYVNAATGSDSNNGLSWATAFATLQRALQMSVADDEIWVAKGVYYWNFNYSMNVNFRKFYGGFAGNETDVSQRDLLLNQTVIDFSVMTVTSPTMGLYINGLETTGTTAIVDGFSFIPPPFNSVTVSVLSNASKPDSRKVILKNLRFETGLTNAINVGYMNNVEIYNVVINGIIAHGTYGPITLQNCSSPGIKIDGVSITNVTTQSYRLGIYMNYCIADIRNVTIADNVSSSGLASAISVTYSSTITLRNATIYRNTSTATNGVVDGLYLYGSSTSPVTAYLYNTVLVGQVNNCNRAKSGTYYPSITGYNNFINSDPANDKTCGLTNGVNGNQIGSSLDPKFHSAPADNGGNTFTVAIQSISPLIDTGSNTYCAATDQRGVSRPIDGDRNGSTVCDIGAYEFDTAFPQVSRIYPVNPGPTSQSTVVTVVRFTKPVTGVDLSDFNLQQTGITGASIQSVTGSGAVYNVTIDTGTGEGSLRVWMPSGATVYDELSQAVSNLPFYQSPLTYIDKLPPTITSYYQLDPPINNWDEVAYLVGFSEIVRGVDQADFSLQTTGLVGAGISGVLNTCGEEYCSLYLVFAGTGSGSGTLKLALSPSVSIQDQIGNAFVYTSIDFPTYTIDREPPTVLSVTRIGSPRTNSSIVYFLVTFSEPVEGVAASDFEVIAEGGLTGAYVVSVSGSGESYIVTVYTGNNDGTIRLNVITQ
ncbi:MAG: choice-of-anchor Q domain-containing protein [Anaerolineales bacterium]